MPSVSAESPAAQSAGFVVLCSGRPPPPHRWRPSVSTTPEVLFVCVHNAGRLQMGAALLAHQATGRVHVRSAGSHSRRRGQSRRRGGDGRSTPARATSTGISPIPPACPVEGVRPIREDIDRRVRALLDDLTPTG